MKIFIAINEIIKITVILYCFGNLAGKGKKLSIQIGMGMAVIAICFILKVFWGKHIFLGILIEVISLAFYVMVCYFVNLLEKYMYLLMLYVILDLLYLVIAVVGFPFIALLNLKPKTVGTETLILILLYIPTS